MNLKEMFDAAIQGLVEWDDEAFVHLTDEQLQQVIEESGRIHREALAARDGRKDER